MSVDDLQRWMGILRWLGVGAITFGLLLTFASHYLADKLLAAKPESPVAIRKSYETSKHASAPAQLKGAALKPNSPSPVPEESPPPTSSPQTLPDGRVVKGNHISGDPTILLDHVKNADRLEKEGKLPEASLSLELAIETSLKSEAILTSISATAEDPDSDKSIQSRMLAQSALLAFRLGDQKLGESRVTRFFNHTPPTDIKAHLVKLLIDRKQTNLVRPIIDEALSSDDPHSKRFLELLADPNFPSEDEL